jgi:cytoskeletal protein CcmA (bactofilin family)
MHAGRARTKTEEENLWNKRTAETGAEQPQRTQPAAPIPVPAARPEPAPVRSEPARPSVNPTSSSVAVIGPSMRINGQIYSQEPLYVDGEVDGSLELAHSLTVGQNGKVKADIKARDVTIFGSVKGNVEVREKIAIREKGSLIGDIKTAGIVIDDGAYFKGSIDIMRPETPRPVSAPAHPAVAKTGT